MWWNKAKRAVAVKAAAKPALAMALEPRMLFDGAVAATVAEATDAKPAAEAAAKDAQAHPAQDNGAHDTQGTQDGVPAGTADHRQEVVFVDAHVKNYQQLVSALKPGTEVVVLQDGKDGLQQIADFLQGRSDVGSIHVLSHGDVGKIELGGQWLDAASLAAHSDALARIGQALGEHGDILLYGCSVGAEGAGRDFLQSLANATGADVAASNDATGAASRGGDWTLEQHLGVVETSALAFTDYDALLAAPSSENFDGVAVDGSGHSFGTPGQPRNIGNWTFSLLNASGSQDTGPDSYVDVTNLSSESSLANNGSDHAAFLNGTYQAVTGTQAAAVFKATSSEEFALVSLVVERGYSDSGAYRLVAYRDGVAVSGATQNFTAGDFGSGGTLVTVSGAAWQFIDEVRIVRQDGAADVSVYLDDITVGVAVPPNVAPTVGSLNGDSVTFVEKGGAVLLDVGGNALVSDADSPDFSGGRVVVSIIGNRVAGEDLLSIRNQGSGAGQIGVSGSTVTYGGVAIGTFTGGSGSTDLTITLNASSNAAAVSALLRNLTYDNSSANPSVLTRTLSVGVNDGDSAAVTSSTLTVSVSAVNDAPTLTPANSTASYTENGSGAIILPAIVVADVDSSTLQGASVSIADFRTGDMLSMVASNGFTGSYNAGTGVLTITGSGSVAGLQAVLRSITYSSSSDDPTFGGTDATRQITLTVTDSSSGTSSAATSQVAINAINDAPTLSGGPYVWVGTNEDATSSAVSVSSLLASGTYGDADGPGSGIALTGLVGAGTWQYSTDGVTWTSVGAVSNTAALLLSATTQLRYVPDGQNGEAATLTYRGWDQSAGSASVNGVRSTADTSANGGSTAYSTGTMQATLSVASVNDAPVLTPTAPSLNGLTDSDTNNVGQAVSSFASGATTDVDSGAVRGIAITGLNAGLGTWQYSLNGGASWQDVGSVSSASALLLRSSDRVRFIPDGVNATSADLTYRAWDQSGASAGQQGTKADASATGGSTPFSTASDTLSVTVVAVNDAPLVTSSGGSATFVEGADVASTPVVIDSGIAVSDSDSPLLSSATVRISGNFISVEDVLGFINNPATMGDISGSYDAATGALTLASAGGASAAQWQAALRSVTYSNSSDTPNTATRTISFSVNDGQLDSAAATRTVTVTAANDAPQLSLPGVISLNEDTSRAITGISVSDVDAGTSDVRVTFTLPAGSGTLSAAVSGSITVGTAANTVILTGRVADINAYLAGQNLTFAPAANFNGNVTLNVDISDLGSSGGPAKTDSGTLTLQVAAVNDAPGAPVVPSSPVAAVEDVPLVLSGISFNDIDAGSGLVQVTFDVPAGSGTFSALASSGVTLTGSGTNQLVLSGTLSDLNTFVASGAVSYLSAANASGTATVTVTLDDRGNTGSGGAQSSSASFNLAITAVNDAPVNSVPAPQTMLRDGSLLFSAGQGNAISISDVDASGGAIEVTLTALNGTISLGGTTGLTFLVGSGSSDPSMTFQGNLADINAALNGLTFQPTAGYFGSASLLVTSNDLGMTGSGGTKSDTDIILISVEQPNPRILGVGTSTPNGSYRVGDQIQVQVQFDQSVFVDTGGGMPTLLLETGVIDRSATYFGGSGSNTLTFFYVVQAGDLSADLNYASTGALSLNGSQIRNGANDMAFLTLPGLASSDSLASRADLVVDGVAPTVASVSVPANGTYVAGQSLDFVVNFTESVTVDTTGGIPHLTVTLDNGGTVLAQYLSGSGTSALTFRLVVANGHRDSNGISLGSSIQANGGTLRDSAGNDLAPTLNNVGSTSGVLVDAVAPTVSSVSVPTSAAYNAGDTLTFVVNASEAVLVGGVPRLALDIGGNTVFAHYVAGSGGANLVFQYTVQPGDNDADGVQVIGLQANGATLQDAAGNAMNLTLNNVAGSGGVIVDTVAPTPLAIATLDPSPSTADSVRYTVTFSEAVSGVDLTDFSLAATGSASGTLSGLVQIEARTFQLSISGITGTGTLGLSLNGSGTGIVDGAGNPLLGGLTGQVYSIDRDAPVITGVSVPPGGLHPAGDTLEFSVDTREAVIVNGTPRLAIDMGGRTVFADYVSGSGGNSLVFRYTVQPGDNDGDGIQVLGLTANGGSLTDAAGNALNLDLNNVGDSRGVLVDTRAPGGVAVVRQDASPTRADTVNFLVTFDENVNGVDVGDFSLVSSNSARGTVLSVTQLDGQTYRVTVGNVGGQGSLGLAVAGGGIHDAAGNLLAQGFSGDSYVIGSLSDGDPQFRVEAPALPEPPRAPLQPAVPVVGQPLGNSPVIPPSLFQPEGVGGLPPLGQIFIQNGAPSQSFIAQVFGESNFGDGSGKGFLGFGGGDGGVFGSSTLASMFSRDGFDQSQPLKAFERRGADIDQGIRGIFGAPSLAQQLDQINQSEQQPVRELAWALGQIAQDRGAS